MSWRVEHIRQQMLEHRPELIVMYGTGQSEEWEKIAGGCFDVDEFHLMAETGTVAAVAPHPVTRGLENEYWVTLGHLLRRTSVQSSH